MPQEASENEALFSHAVAADSSCISVSSDGRVIAQRHFDAPEQPESPQPAWSITKSVASLLVGIAQQRGDLHIDDPVSDYVAEWKDSPSAEVTIRDILSNTSGRHWDRESDYRELALRADDKTAFAIALGQDVAPGEAWVYNNSAIQVLDAVLETATGTSVATFAEPPSSRPRA